MVLETLPRSAIILPPPIFSLLGTAHGSIILSQKDAHVFICESTPPINAPTNTSSFTLVYALSSCACVI